MKAVELFAGAGGIALGCELGGFTPQIVSAWDRWASDTVRENQGAGYPMVAGWKGHGGDVRDVDWSQVTEPVDLVGGGPPCQPSGMGGKARSAKELAKWRPFLG